VRLLSAAILGSRERDFGTRSGRLPGHYDLPLLDDPVAGQTLKFYLLLTEMPALVADLKLSAEDLFWNRYYWFLRYARLRQAATGPDAGLEQQAFQMLEHPYPPCSPDWALLDEIEAAVEREIASQLESLRRTPTPDS